MSIESKVIGYYAHNTKEGTVLTDGKAMVVAGSEDSLKSYMGDISDAAEIRRFKIKKTRFGDIMNGMSMGGEYAFDKESYGRFLPLSKKAGLNLNDNGGDAFLDADEDVFLTVRPKVH